ncbi:hypothetical protein A6R68_07191 [Neotoma lepida]|uniref:UPAR/Ly6 domain-containing protein n=1 Tax=Neotoma lepida TaxID=56216 RepID=A0A1A6GEJ4_NEOLE|nr:hypothetical protein A6R68_07191 [Neotoma lepida]
MDLEQGALPSLMGMVLFTFRFTCLMEMMHPFFLIILLGLPWVNTTVNSTSGLDNSTSGLDTAIKPRQEAFRCYICASTNTFNCFEPRTCTSSQKFCLIVALRMNSRELLVHKNCIDICSFTLAEPPPADRKISQHFNFYYTMCCRGTFCNVGGPGNLERDLFPPSVIEERVIARAVCLGEFNLLLSLSLILSSSILT